MDQAVSHQTLTAEARVPARVRGICDGQSGTGTGSSRLACNDNHTVEPQHASHRGPAGRLLSD
jgi:hypothetical protein